MAIIRGENEIAMISSELIVKDLGRELPGGTEKGEEKGSVCGPCGIYMVHFNIKLWLIQCRFLPLI